MEIVERKSGLSLWKWCIECCVPTSDKYNAVGSENIIEGVPIGSSGKN